MYGLKEETWQFAEAEFRLNQWERPDLVQLLLGFQPDHDLATGSKNTIFLEIQNYLSEILNQ